MVVRVEEAAANFKSRSFVLLPNPLDGGSDNLDDRLTFEIIPSDGDSHSIIRFHF